MTSKHTENHPASFRDPAGFVFRSPQGDLFRQVNEAGASDYDQLMQSGLYAELANDGKLIEHTVVDTPAAEPTIAHCVLQPRVIPTISYPYEWSFSALKEAALLTLDVHRKALGQGMSLKDASAYNIQFEGWKPIFIDTLSFERYSEDRPWSAFGQFCRHFLAPLALMVYQELGMGRLLALHIDGIPLDTACRLLPLRARFNTGLLMHLFMNASLTRSYSDTRKPLGKRKIPQVTKKAQLILLDSLEKTIRGLQINGHATTWGDYYETNSYDAAARHTKETAVRVFLASIKPNTTWDLGANTGLYSQIAADMGVETVAFDIDPVCVEGNYHACVSNNRRNLLPLTLDLTNPSPGVGWANCERDSVAQRGGVDAVMALALIHHLGIASNIPLPMIADYFQTLGRHLIIEWVPKSDPQVQRLLRSREDIFEYYTREHFEAAFQRRFTLLKRLPSGADDRTLYFMKSAQVSLVGLTG